MNNIDNDDARLGNYVYNCGLLVVARLQDGASGIARTSSAAKSPTGQRERAERERKDPIPFPLFDDGVVRK